MAPNWGSVNVLRAPWVRIASSVQAWAGDTSESRSAPGAGCAQLQTTITQRKQCDFGGA